jgi:hypothetical protein
MAEETSLNASAAKRLLDGLVTRGALVRHGVHRGTLYGRARKSSTVTGDCERQCSRVDNTRYEVLV